MKNECTMEHGLLQDFAEGTIEPLERVFVEEHLKSCQACRKVLNQYKLLLWDLDHQSLFDVEYPKELGAMERNLVERVLGQEKGGAGMALLDSQRAVLSNSMNFAEYLPGVKESKKLVRLGAKGLVAGVKNLIAK